jgi:hypothetical protein
LGFSGESIVLILDKKIIVIKRQESKILLLQNVTKKDHGSENFLR